MRVGCVAAGAGRQYHPRLQAGDDVTVSWQLHVLAALVFILLTASACTHGAVRPSCTNPARLLGHHDRRAPGGFIGFKSTVSDTKHAAEALAEKYHLSIGSQYGGRSVFVRELSPSTVGALLGARC